MKKFLALFLFIFLLAGCSDSTDSFDTIPLSEVNDKIETGYIVMDVREPYEFAEGHIPGAINKPLSELEEDDFSNLNKDEQYVIICRSGNRSAIASDILYSKGYNIVNTAEGMSTWQGDVEK